MEIKITKAQLKAIIEMTNDVSAMIGCGDYDKMWKKYIRLIDKMLKKNGFKRDFK